MRDPTRFTRRDITGFLHNAQLAAADQIEDYKIPAINKYSRDLYHLFTTDSQFTPQDLIAVLTSVAYALHTGGVDGKKTQTTGKVPRTR